MAHELETRAPARPAAAARADAAPGHPPALKILWAVNVDYACGIEHGGHLRVFNLARELVSGGHEVHLAVMRKAGEDAAARREYLEDLRGRGIITDYLELEYTHPKALGKLARLALHPAAVNRLLRRAQRPTTSALREAVARRGIDLCVVGDRNLLFALRGVREVVPTVVDWVDSYVLYRSREIKHDLSRRRLGRAAKSLRYMFDDFMAESYYGRLGDANLVVSPVDREWLDRVNGSPRKNRVLLNGVNEPPAGARREAKVKNRIIFTGNMNFPPNYESAIWFIDRVLPLLLERKGDLRLVIAGANPVGELAARAGGAVEVTGYVEDMGREIAKSELYVAPLVCGGGFKNKVIEAVTNGTFVVATSMAVEFLGREAREQFLLGDTPEQMAGAILEYLDCPQKFEPRLAALRRHVREEFSWESRARELVALARDAAGAGRNRNGRGARA